MELYNECLTGVNELLEHYPFKSLDITKNTGWKDSGKNQIILKSDTAFELGGGTMPAVSSIALTDSVEFVPVDEVLLIGRDLPEINSDLPFARIAIIRVDESEMGSGEALYQAIRKIEFARYHLHPDGYMPRISAFTHREAVRVGKQGIKDGLNFAKVGKLFIDEYKKHTPVKAVKLLFVTDPAFPYEKLEKIMEKSEQITTALDHIMKNIKMDCETCTLKKVCDEVEALCDRDFPRDENSR